MRKHWTIKEKKIGILISVLLIAFVTFLPVLRCGFTDWDDDILITENPNIRAITAQNVKAIFSSITLKTYVPLTVLSFALEYALVKDNPVLFHWDNLFLHLGVTALVFLIALELGLSIEAAGLASLLFAVHPMRVESVAWVTERKDVLYAFFYLLAIFSYLRFLQTKKKKAYFLTLLWGLLSILAKPMALSLPLILFVVDWVRQEKVRLKMFLLKIPHFLYVLPIAAITYSVNSRVPNAKLPEALWVWIWSFTFYIRKFLWPVDLKPLYAFPSPVSLANYVYIESVMTLCVILMLVYSLRKNRLFIFAWLYYFFSIFFLLRFDYAMDLGIVADRFMYLPSLGFCYFFGYLVIESKKQWEGKPWRKMVLSVFLIVLFLFLSVSAFRQISVWKDKASLWEYLIDTFPNQDIGYNNMGLAFLERGDFDRALKCYNKSIEINPVRAKIFVNRGNLYARRKEYVRAITDYQIAEQIDPALKEIYLNLGGVLVTLEKYNLAIVNFTKAINLDDTYIPAYLRRANLLMIKKDYPLALRDYTRIVELSPKFVQGYVQRGNCYRVIKRNDLALADFSRALELDPKNVPALASRGNLYGLQHEYEKALKDLNKAIQLSPQMGILYNDRGVIYGMMGKVSLAMNDYNQTIQRAPDYAPVYFARSLLYKSMNRHAQALKDALKAKALGYEGIDTYLRQLQSR